MKHNSEQVSLFSDQFMPHGHCYFWEPTILWTNVGSDAIIALAYFSIPITLVFFLLKKQELMKANMRYAWVVVLFATFIMACGVTHLFNIWTVWTPSYALHGFVKLLTAVVSLATAVAIIPLVPKLLTLKSAEELEKINADLIEEIQRRERAETENIELADALEKLENAQSLLVRQEKLASLGEMVSGLAHEVNTPIGIALSASSTLNDTTDQLMKEFEAGTIRKSSLLDGLTKARQASTLALNNANRAAEIIAAFKTVSVDQASSAMRSIELGEYIDEVLLNLHPKLKQTKLDVSVKRDAPIQMHTTPGVISQVFTNLIENSILHGYDEPKEGQICISLEEKDSSIEIVYSDDGKGIPADEQERVFEQFFTTRREKGGSGIGLYLVRDLIESALGGSVELSNNNPNGVRFKISMPKSNLVA